MTDKLEIKDIMAAVDLGAKDLWDSLNLEQQKSVAFFILNRYLSSVKTNKREIAEHYVEITNEVFNKNFYNVSKHSKLLWQLMCICSHPDKKIQYHEWIGLKRKADSSNKKVKLLQELYPTAKINDLEVLASLNDKKDIIQLAKDSGWDDKKINEFKL